MTIRGPKPKERHPDELVTGMEWYSEVDPIPLPDGLEPLLESEEIRWGQYTSVRVKADWRDIDLVLVHRIIKNETMMQGWRAMVRVEGDLIPNGKGVLMIHPLIDKIRAEQTSQIRLMRAAGLFTSVPSNDSEMPRRAKQEEKKRQLARAMRNDGPSSLLAH